VTSRSSEVNFTKNYTLLFLLQSDCNSIPVTTGTGRHWMVRADLRGDLQPSNLNS